MSDTPTPPPAGDSTNWLPPSPEELQKLLPQYEISALIGRGGMGAVYRGRQANLDRPVAIKILPPGLDETDATFSERFRNEALAMAKLNHPGLVAVYDFGKTSNGMLYIVMEFVDGTDVAHMMAKKGRLSSDHAMAITAHVCDALKYAHERGIVHRDIKPANIMVGYDGVVKVADFGLAKTSKGGQSVGLTQSGLAMGTMHYIAPEALILGTSVDQRADIYAMGVMLYHMLTGDLPQGMFELPSLQVPGLDPRYDGIISRALRNDRERRYQTVGELRHDLDAILTQPVTQVNPDTKKAPAALNTTARPQRPAGPPMRPAGEPQRGPQKQALPPPPPKTNNLGFWVPVVSVAIICAGFVFWKERTKSDASISSVAAAADAPKASTIAESTKERPFINSLGMKFVPVPGTDVLMCIHETRNQDYKPYASAVRGVNPPPVFDKTPSDQADDHPVRNARHDDAVGFCKWLSSKEGKTYRLPSDQEWSFATGIGQEEKREAGTTPESLNGKLAKEFPWGSQWPPPKGFGNFGDTSLKEFNPDSTYIEGYTDGFPTTAPVMSFQPNSLGIYDMSGNVPEWVQDWWNAQQKDRATRGSGYWSSDMASFYASRRGHLPPSALYNNANIGFRCVVEINSSGNSAAPPSSSSSSATSAASFKTDKPEAVIFDGHRYQLVEENLPWDDAKSRAEQLGGHLATITSAEENQWITELVRPHLTSLYSCCWLGAVRRGNGAKWQWVTGELFDFNNWHPGEPNSNVSTASLAIWRPDVKKDLINWNDTHFSNVLDVCCRGFVVEWDDDGKKPTPNELSIRLFADRAPKILSDVFAPLKEKLPDYLRPRLVSMRDDLIAEGKEQPATSLDAYRAAYALCVALLSAMDERDAARSEPAWSARSLALRPELEDLHAKARRLLGTVP